MLTYLCSPYTSNETSVREERFRQACAMTATLLRAGYLTLSPVVHSHPLVQFGLDGTWNFWRSLDMVLLARCDEVAVLTLPGWKESRGVQAELRLARQLGKSVRYLDPGLATGSPTIAVVATQSES